MTDLTLADGTVLEVFSDGSMRVSYEDVSVDLSPLVHGQWNWVQALTTEVAAREKAKRERDEAIKEIGKQGELRGKAEAQVEVLREALERIVVIEEAITVARQSQATLHHKPSPTSPPRRPDSE